MAQQLMNPTSIHEDSGQSLTLLSGLRIHHLLWLWCMSVATALIGPLVWETPYAVGVALKRPKKKKKKEFKKAEEYRTGKSE